VHFFVTSFPPDSACSFTLLPFLTVQAFLMTGACLLEITGFAAAFTDIMPQKLPPVIMMVQRHVAANKLQWG